MWCKWSRWCKKCVWCGSMLLLVSLLVTVLPLMAQKAAIDCRTRFNPTEDKPQSKLWQARGNWWAWLPYESFGGRIWKRNDSGWSAVNSLDSLTRILPGRADIWSNGDTVMAALVQGKNLAVARIVWDDVSGGYVPGDKPLEWQANSSEAETVTLERAPNGQFAGLVPGQRSDCRAGCGGGKKSRTYR